MNLEGFKRTSSDKLYLAIQDKKNIPLNKFLTSLSISKLGSNVGELLADNFKTLEKIEYITKGELLEIDGIGETITNNIIENVSFIELIADLLINNGCTIIDKNTNQDNLKESEIKNLNVCITGSMEIIERKNAKQLIKDFGGYMKSSVSAKTDLLVCNEVSTSGKYKKASELGVKIITEKEFLKMIGM
jgi:DNA ligase (NAD+)